MNRKDFLQTIMVRYKGYFRDEEQSQQWLNDYKSQLPESIDFEKLNKAMLRGYMSSSQPPTPAWLLERWYEIKAAQAQQDKKYVPPRDGAPPTPEFLALRDSIKRFAAGRGI